MSGTAEAIAAVQRLADYVLENGGDEQAVMEDVDAATQPIRALQTLEHALAIRP